LARRVHREFCHRNLSPKETIIEPDLSAFVTCGIILKWKYVLWIVERVLRVFYSRTILLWFVLAVAAGCNLSVGAPSSEETPLPTIPLEVVSVTATSQPVPTNTPIPTACTPRSDWAFTYTIQSGDTLADIASRANTNALAVAQGNCLSNPDDIDVGQQLRLPQAPVADSNPPTYVTYTNTLPGLGIAFEFPENWAVLDNPNNLLMQGTDGSAFEIIYSDAGQTTPIEAVVNQCKTAGACIGNRAVTGEAGITLPSGLTGYRLDLSAGTDASSTPMVMVFMVVNNRNLSVRGFGDLTIFNTILNSLRLYSP
jgi:LysM repeat protein